MVGRFGAGTAEPRGPRRGNVMDVDQYTARLGYAGPRAPTPATLMALHRRHMLTVPFENLDIPLGRHITLAPEALWAKVIVTRRGGFCYELNTLFGGLLRALGYHVDWLSARVWSGTGWGPDKDHMALRVEVDGVSWLADVGFGDSFLIPMRLDAGIDQEVGFTSFRLVRERGQWIVQALSAGREWEHRYRFDLEPHDPESFQSMCDHQQTSPESTFTRRAVCSRATERGRVTVTHDRLIVTAEGERDETPLPDAVALRAALAAHHGICLTAVEAETIVKRFAGAD